MEEAKGGQDSDHASACGEAQHVPLLASIAEVGFENPQGPVRYQNRLFYEPEPAQPGREPVLELVWDDAWGYPPDDHVRACGLAELLDLELLGLGDDAVREVAEAARAAARAAPPEAMLEESDVAATGAASEAASQAAPTVASQAAEVTNDAFIRYLVRMVSDNRTVEEAKVQRSDAVAASGESGASALGGAAQAKGGGNCGGGAARAAARAVEQKLSAEAFAEKCPTWVALEEESGGGGVIDPNVAALAPSFLEDAIYAANGAVLPALQDVMEVDLMECWYNRFNALFRAFAQGNLLGARALISLNQRQVHPRQLVRFVGDNGEERVCRLHDPRCGKKPDGGIGFNVPRGPANRPTDVLSTMEVKIANAEPRGLLDDMSLCVLLCCSTALTLKNAGVVSAEILVPFLMGHGLAAALFVVRFDEEGQHLCVQSVRLSGSSKAPRMESKLAVHMVFVALAFLLRQLLLRVAPHADRVREICGADMDEAGEYLFRFWGKLSTSSRSRRSKPESGASDRSPKRRASGGSGGIPVDDLMSEDEARRPENDAICALLQCGAIDASSVKAPFRPELSIFDFLRREVDWSKHYQQTSPFFFTARSKEDGAQLFLKVWRHGDRKADVKWVREEVRLLKKAESCGVPAARVVAAATASGVRVRRAAKGEVAVQEGAVKEGGAKEEATIASVTRDETEVEKTGSFGSLSKPAVGASAAATASASEGGGADPNPDPDQDPAAAVEDTFEVLCMMHMGRLGVKAGDVRAWAESLVQAVCALHERAGILHCDIKTQNLAWDEKERCVSLLDFGHAQEEERAVALSGTRGFEAPEVVQKKPNTRATDAYAVGATVLDVLDTLQLEDELLRSVGARLVERDAVQRMTLRGALHELSAGIGAALSDGVDRIRAATTEKAVGESGGREATGSDGRTDDVVEDHVTKKLRS